jgi:hypothetical protein
MRRPLYISKVAEHISQFSLNVIGLVPLINKVSPRGRPMGLPLGPTVADVVARVPLGP